MAKIGILNVRGAMPHYEQLPFNVYVDKPGIIKDLDALILPPGTLVESQVLTRYDWIKREVWEFAENGGIVVGVCSGAQLLSRAVNLNVKGLPGYAEGLGILDITFEPLIVTGPVKVKITNESWITRDLLNTELHGWQAHTYGKANVELGNTWVVGVSLVSRYNYRNAKIEIPTLMISRKYRVFGTMVHGLLDLRSPLARNLFHEIGISNKREFKKYYRFINANGWKRKNDVHITPRIITITSTMTGEGKTLITSALAYCLSRAGHYVGIAKLGGDIRDLHPGLYILGKPFRPWMSIRMRWGSRVLGWFDWRRTLRKAVEIGLDTLLVEGVMGLLTGSSRRNTRDFSSTLGFIRRVNTDIVLIASAHYDGIEGALLRLKANINLLNKLGKRPVVAILNNAYHGIHEDRALRRFRMAINKLGISLFVVDTLMISSKPEELIDLEDYRDSATKISSNLRGFHAGGLGC